LCDCFYEVGRSNEDLRELTDVKNIGTSIGMEGNLENWKDLRKQ
jgi:hypothetical protein